MYERKAKAVEGEVIEALAPASPAPVQKSKRGGGNKGMAMMIERRKLTVLAMRLSGIAPSVIQQKLNISYMTYWRIVKNFKSEEWVARAVERLDTLGIPLAVDNVLAGLDKGDKQYTLELLKGRGILYPQGAAEGQAQQPFMVKIVQPQGGGEVIIAAGAVVGTPNRG